jgi:hypothetical protein
MAGSPFTPASQRRIAWQWLGVGLVLAFAFTLAPPLRFMGWLLGSLFHETGHVAFAWYVGCPAFPAISLAGHAGAFHKPQSALMLFVVAVLLLAFAAWAWREGRWRRLATGLILVWPLLAFVDGLRDLGFLLSGHLGELTFAGIFLVRARTGSSTELEAERPLYACLGWFLVARNVALTGGLVLSAAARSAYLGNGSFGMLNDYARIAFHVLHVPLQAVAFGMLLVSLLVVPVVLWLTRGTDGAPRGSREPAGRRPYEPAPLPANPAPTTEADLSRPPPSVRPRRTIPISRVPPR